ncbi:ATPase-like protein [Bathymodiolus heckerae thiotrophic gill symbiont]|uniref:BREX system P-loop protein BrxC n=1 Tax=Bathymodiolus heckerae thiotrophic gill symbiont TaxID=1052212 RepID=UPI0010B40AAA|nr:BREX system P-loop protein BrxC [Bathymodiolus heckerae thiotrophic gill symbiont]SHN93058.1 ATPase-like protein [Bathymodiolus heckerae thiotrophic gill symbiont]
MIPLYRFYSSIESFLDTSVKRTINQAASNPGLESFDIGLLRILFLIRYVEEIKGNVSNLTTLSITQIDADRLALKQQIEESLLRLERETLISRNGEDYFFLTNEEQDINKEIKAVEISSTEEAKEMGELIYEDLLKGQTKFRYLKNSKDFNFARLCDAHPIGNKLDYELIVSVITPLADDYQSYDPSRCIMQSTQENGQVIFKLTDDALLGQELRTYLRTEKYIRLKNSDSLPHTTKRIIQDRADENRQRHKRLTDLVETAIHQGECYVCGQTLTATATSVKNRLDNALHYLVENSFSKLSKLTPFKGDHLKEIQALLRSNDINQQTVLDNMPETNPDALQEIRSYIDLSTHSSHKIILKDIIGRYEKRPYGWPEWDSMLLLTHLLVTNEINLLLDASPLSRDRIFEDIKKPSSWAKIQVIRKKTLDSHTLQKARQLGKDIFASMGPDGEEPLFNYLHQSAQQWQEQLKSFKPLADTGSYPGKKTIDQSIKLLDQLLHDKDSYSFIEKFNRLKNELLDLSDDYHDLHNFYQNQKTIWTKLTSAYQLANQNRHSLDKNPDAVSILTQIDNILKSESPYGIINQAEQLISKITAINEQLIDEKRGYQLKTGQNSRLAAEFLYHKVND